MYAVFYHSGQYSVALTGLRAAGHIIDWHGHIPCPSVQSVAVTESGGTLLERIERTPSKETWVWEDATRKAFDELGPMLARWLDEGNRVAILGVDNAERFTLAVTQTATAFIQGAVLWAVSDDEAMKETMLAHRKEGQPHRAVAECCKEVLQCSVWKIHWKSTSIGCADPFLGDEATVLATSRPGYVDVRESTRMRRYI